MRDFAEHRRAATATARAKSAVSAHHGLSVPSITRRRRGHGHDFSPVYSPFIGHARAARKMGLIRLVMIGLRCGHLPPPWHQLFVVSSDGAWLIIHTHYELLFAPRLRLISPWPIFEPTSFSDTCRAQGSSSPSNYFSKRRAFFRHARQRSFLSLDAFPRRQPVMLPPSSNIISFADDANAILPMGWPRSTGFPCIVIIFLYYRRSASPPSPSKLLLTGD